MEGKRRKEGRRLREKGKRIKGVVQDGGRREGGERGQEGVVGWASDAWEWRAIRARNTVRNTEHRGGRRERRRGCQGNRSEANREERVEEEEERSPTREEGDSECGGSEIRLWLRWER